MTTGSSGPPRPAFGFGPDDIESWTDAYFNKTRAVVGAHGDSRVTYALFIRRPVIAALEPAIDWLHAMAASRATRFDIEACYSEGKWVGSGEPLLYVTGSFYHLCDLETLLLQKVGPPCVAAYNAYTMCADMPWAAFLAMDGRHCIGPEMMDLMAYACRVGSDRARRKDEAVGFTGNATHATAYRFGRDHGLGTMPHALIGYANSTVRAAEMYYATFPAEPLTVLVDYFGQEVTDALAVCHRFPQLAAAGRLAVRVDTPGGRFLEGLDPPRSYAVLERHVPKAIRGYREERELNSLIGPGTSAAAIYHMREQLDQAGFDGVRLVASSGFGPAKCRIMGEARVPLDIVGTGSYLPQNWPETYATADIVEYDGVPRVKVGREFLLRDYPYRTRAE